MDRKDELDHFKRNIDLADFAAWKYGFQRDSEKSSKRYPSMKCGDFRIVITLNQTTGHWQFFSPTHDGSNQIGDKTKGTIIELVQYMEPGQTTLGEVRKILRDYLAMPAPLATKPTPVAVAPAKDRAAVVAYLKRYRPVQHSEYLAGRGISTATLKAPAIYGKVLAGYNGAVIFPHWDEQGVCGYEVKGPNLTLFSEQGYKSLWVSHRPQDLARAVVCESGVEVLSYCEYFNPPGTVYISLAGSFSPEVGERLGQLLSRLAVPCVGAFNQDQGGHRHAEKLANIANAAGVPYSSHLPEKTGYDWNNVLMEDRKHDRQGN